MLQLKNAKIKTVKLKQFHGPPLFHYVDERTIAGKNKGTVGQHETIGGSALESVEEDVQEQVGDGEGAQQKGLRGTEEGGGKGERMVGT